VLRFAPEGENAVPMPDEMTHDLPQNAPHEASYGAPHQELAQEAVHLLRDVVLTARMAHAEDWTGLDLSVAQLKVVMTIAHAGGAMTVSRMADLLGVRQPTASHLIERLVQGRLVERAEDPEDRRRTLVHLTPAGEQLVGRLLGFAELLRGWMSALVDSDLLALRQGLAALLEVARREAPETLKSFQDQGR
jgi:MarR family transcriptional regulator for hemolysin